MKITARAILLMSTVLLAVLATLPLPAVGDDVMILAGPTHAPRPKIAILDCSHGWTASAQGQYGGAGFALFCQNGRDRQRLDGVTGTAYTMRVGAESESTGLDCFFTGDAATVDVTCASAARITIR